MMNKKTILCGWCWEFVAATDRLHWDILGWVCDECFKKKRPPPWVIEQSRAKYEKKKLKSKGPVSISEKSISTAQTKWSQMDLLDTGKHNENLNDRDD